MNDVYVRLESPRTRFSWRGSLTTFARNNSLTPAQMFELYGQLERSGAAPLNAYGEDRYILRREVSTVRSKKPFPASGTTRYPTD